MTEDRGLDGEYTRFRAKVQLGDGPDQRGEVTVETVREVTEPRRKDRVRLPETEGDVFTGVSAVQGVPANDKVFAEFYAELTRAGGALRDALDLDPEVES